MPRSPMTTENAPKETEENATSEPAKVPNTQQLQAAGFAKFCDACGGDVRSNGMDTVCVACGTLVP